MQKTITTQSNIKNVEALNITLDHMMYGLQRDDFEVHVLNAWDEPVSLTLEEDMLTDGSKVYQIRVK
jgi:hypothetical protein